MKKKIGAEQFPGVRDMDRRQAVLLALSLLSLSPLVSPAKVLAV
jgi:hypothetical protein